MEVGLLHFLYLMYIFLKRVGEVGWESRSSQRADAYNEAVRWTRL